MRRHALATLVVSAVLAGPAFSADTPTKVVDKTLPLAADGRLSVDTYKGRVTVTTWDRAEVAVHAVVTPDGTCAEAADLVAKTRVRIEGGGREVRVVSDYDDLPKFTFSFRDDCGSRPFVAYEIRMPRTAALSLKDHKSRISVEGLAGDASIESYKGVVRLEKLSGRLDLETYKGNARADLDRVAGDLRFETYKGDIDVVVPKGSRLALHEDIGRRGRFEVDLEDAGTGPVVSVETYKGSIRLRTR